MRIVLSWRVWLYIMVGLGYAGHEAGLHQQTGATYFAEVLLWPAAAVEELLDQTTGTR